MKPRQTPPQHRARFGRIELGRPAAQPGKHGETEVSKTEQGAAADVEWRSDGHFGGGELRGESMFFGDLRVAPTRRAIEFQHQRAFAAPHLVHTVLITVEREEPAVALESQ